MGFWERLIGGEPAPEQNLGGVLPELLASYQEEVRLARQIREHADRAPHQAGIQQLRAVAEEQERLVSLLRDKIVSLGGEEGNASGSVKEGKNHWARAVQDMDDTLVLERRYNTQARRYDSESPDAAALFRTLEREKARIYALLRDVALRADPHALD